MVRSLEIIQKVIVIIYVKDVDGLDYSGNSGGGEKW